MRACFVRPHQKIKLLFMNVFFQEKMGKKRGYPAVTAFLLAILLYMPAWAQDNIRIKGKIIDEVGLPVAGATITVKGQNTGATTDDQGNFEIPAPANGTLIISSINYVQQEVAINNRQTITVTLAISIQKIENEVIVVGYGSARKKDVTGSVASISGTQMNEVPSANIARALQGRIAGVQMTQTSSKPGTAMQIRIRGTRSLNATNDPLIVLDGIPFPGSISDIDPNDIKSIDILKDASATAIYGSRGANGVVLITTNKGQAGQKAKLTYNTFNGFKKVFAKYPMMNGPEYWALRKANNATPGASIRTNTIDEDSTMNTDWQDLLYRTGWVTNHDLGFSGGSDKGNYSVGFGYYKDQAVIPLQYYERFSIRTSLEQRIGSLLRLGLTSNNSYATTHDNNLGPGSALGLTPLINPYNADGSMKAIASINTSGAQWLYTRQALEALGDKYIDLNRAFNSYNAIYAELKIPGVNGLKYRANLGLNFRQSNYGAYTGQGVFSGVPTTVSSANISNSQTAHWVIENLLTYDRTFAQKHKINAVAMYSTEQNTTWSSSASAQDIPADAFQFYNLGRANVSPIINPANQNHTRSGLMSYMGRVMYSYDDRYMLSATYRSDASSVLAPGHQWHAYPAVSAGWNIKNEKFMQNIDVLDALKLRVGYGETSNQAINPYQTLGLLTTVPYNFGPATYSTGMYVTQLPNPNLGWEFSKTWNYAIDFALLKNRLTGTVEYYVQKTDNVLLSVGLPPTSGVNNYTANIGATQNKGFEFSLNGVILDNYNGFTWEAGVNFYANRNKLVKLASGAVKDEGNLWFIGHPIDVIYDYKKTGLWENSKDSASGYMKTLEPSGNVGMIKVLYTGDYNPDGSPVRAIDGTDRQVTDLQPDFEGGFNTRVGYKGFELSVIGSFRSGGVLISTLYGSASYLNNMNSRSGNNVRVDYWTPEHTNAKYPRPGGTGGDNPKYGSTLGYFNASYLKVRTITLGYNFSQAWVKRVGVERVRLYGTAENPFVLFSPYKKESGMDPETNSRANENVAVSAGPARLLTIGTNTPSTRNYLIGLQVTF
jgi:TonB-dependent starch-binding outer membrane protein SusC